MSLLLFLPSFEKEVHLFMVYAFNIQGNSEMFLWESLALFISNKSDSKDKSDVRDNKIIVWYNVLHYSNATFHDSSFLFPLLTDSKMPE